MTGINILILTDHGGHSPENSLYALASALYQHPHCQLLDIASCGHTPNKGFFEGNVESDIEVLSVQKDVSFEGLRETGLDLVSSNIHNYDVVLLRLPPPLPCQFLDPLVTVFPEKNIINRPSGIRETGSKQFLLQFAELCAPMALIESEEQLYAFARKFPIVLKPLQSYSGRGLVRIMNGTAEVDGATFGLAEFVKEWGGSNTYLGMQYLRNVTHGDKRMVVCNGEILGASLRLPPEGSWKCNVGQGGTSMPA